MSPDSLSFIKDVISSHFHLTRAAVIIMQLKAHYDSILIKCKAVKIIKTKWVEKASTCYCSEMPYSTAALIIYVS